MNWQESAIKREERLRHVSKIEEELLNVHRDKTKYKKKKARRQTHLAISERPSLPSPLRSNILSCAERTLTAENIQQKVKWLLSSVLKSFRALKFEPAARLVLLYYTEHNSCVMESCMSVGQQNNFTVKSDSLNDIIYSISEAAGLGED